MAKKTIKSKQCNNVPVRSLGDVIGELEFEFDSIADRIERLDAALKRGDAFIKQVGDEQFQLLTKQFSSMREYRDILAIRLELLRRANARAIERNIGRDNG